MPINMLDSDDDIVGWLGYSGPELTRPEMVNVLEHLFDKGDLIATRTDRNRDQHLGQFMPTRDDIEAGILQKQYFDYGLTAQGGNRWEIITHVDWSMYLAEGFSGNTKNFRPGLPNKSGDFRMLESMNCDLMRQYADSYGRIGVTLIPLLELDHTFIPWQVTYWKTLPSGYQAIYQQKVTDRKINNAALQQAYPDPRLPRWYTIPEL